MTLSGLLAPHRVALVCAAAVACAGIVRGADIDTVESRVKADILSTVPSNATVQGYLTSLQSDGSWTDVAYTSTAQTNWPPLTHLSRMLDMSRAYAGAGTLAGDASLRAGIIKAFDCWIAKAPTSTNWYYNEISVPQTTGQIMVLFRSQLSSSEKTSGIALIQKAYVARSTNSGTNTGANRTDRALAGIYRGIVTPDTAVLSDAFLAIGDTILLTTAEGIQPDYSYQQHGTQLYVQGYGSILTGSVLKDATYGAGTAYTYSDTQIRTLADYMLNGVQWFVRGDTTDYASCGRGLSRPGGTATAGQYTGQLATLLTINNGYRTSEIQAFRSRVQSAVSGGGANASLELSGDRIFPRSDIITHHRPAYYVGVKISSTRTAEPETGNNEGLKNLHLGDGLTEIMRTGNDYDDIMPAWNWYRLPGTTVRQDGHSLKPTADWGVLGTSTFSGGVSDGVYGTLSFDYSKRSVAAKKSWFFFDNEFVALGAGVTSASGTGEVDTTLNQTLLSGDITYRTSATTATLSTGSVTPAGLRWVNHGGVGYFFPTASSTATVATAAQTGDWSAINSTYSGSVTKNVFTLYQNHGTTVTNGTYAYVVAPDMTVDKMDAYYAALPVTVLSNTATIQAVRHTALGITQATFWADATASIGGITVDKKSSVMVKNDGVFLDVSVSDPTQTNTGVINVSVATPAAGIVAADTGVTATSSSSGVTLAVAVNGAAGATFHARFYLNAAAYSAVTLSPVADTYAYDASPSSNYGTASSLVIKSLSSSGYNRESFLKFDLSQVTGTPVAATLGLTVLSVSVPGINAVAPTDPGWTETGLTWSNKPAPGAYSDSWTPAVGVPVNASVTAPVLAALSGTKSLALDVFGLTQTSDGYVTYASKEATDASTRPKLTLFFAHPSGFTPLTVSATSIRENAAGTVRFTVWRDANYTGDLPVSFTLSGTAVAGVNYVSLPASVTIPSGSDHADIVLTPLQDGVATGDLIVTLTLADGSSASLGILDVDTSATPVADTFESATVPATWVASGATLATAADTTLNAGKALAATTSGTFSRVVRNFTAITLANPGDTLMLSADFRYTATPASNSGGFRFGLFDASGNGSYTQLGTGGDKTFSLNRDTGAGYGAGSSTATVAGFSAVNSIADTAKHSLSISLTRTASGSLTMLSTVDGKTVSATDATPPTFAFASAAFRNGSISAAFDLDNVAMTFTHNLPPVFSSPTLATTGAASGATYAASLATYVSDPNAGDTLTYTKVSGPAWLIVNADGSLAGTPAEGDAGTAAFVVRVSDAAGMTADAPLSIGVLTLRESWRLAHFGSSANTGDAADDADPDGDGIPNLFEFAFGSDPRASDASARPVVSASGDNLVLTYLRAKSASGLVFTVEQSVDMVTWTAVAATPLVAPASDTLDLVQVAVPVAGRPSLMLRLRVTAN